MVTTEGILDAYFDCRRGKRQTASAVVYEMDYESRLISLRDRINSRTYQPGKSICFVVTRPRYREVFAASFEDRIVHHYIALRLEPLFELVFSPRTFNCRKGKGQLYGVKMLEADIKEASNNYTTDCYIMKLDLQGFFMSIDKSMLARMIDKFIVKYYKGNDIDDLRYLCQVVVLHCPEKNCERHSPREMWDHLPANKSLFTNGEGKGVAIGNLFAQLFANFLLNTLDWYIEELGIKYHGRYVDDFYIVSEDKKKILSAMPAIRAYLAGIGITLHPHKFFIQHYTKGVRFVGNIVKADRVYVLNRTVNGLRDAIERLNANAKKAINASETMCDEAVWFGGVAGLLEKDVSSVNSYLGFMRHCNAYAVRRRMLAGISDDGYKVVSVVGHFEYIMLKGRYRRRRAMMDALMRRDYDSVFPLIKCDT